MIQDELIYQILQDFGFEPTHDQRNALQTFAQFMTDRRDNAVMILRGSAGTGKTYSICKKLCYLFVDSNEENRIKPEEVAVITFTNNAARELKTRIQTFLTNEEEVADLKKSFGK